MKIPAKLSTATPTTILRHRHLVGESRSTASPSYSKRMENDLNSQGSHTRAFFMPIIQVYIASITTIRHCEDPATSGVAIQFLSFAPIRESIPINIILTSPLHRLLPQRSHRFLPSFYTLVSMRNHPVQTRGCPLPKLPDLFLILSHLPVPFWQTRY